MPSFNRVTIVGLGLIGGSLGMALRRRHLVREVIGYSRKPKTLQRARDRGAINAGTTNLEQAVRDADVVVLATPVDSIAPLARRCMRFMKKGSLLTDVGSTKSAIVEEVERFLPKGLRFVGAHPIVGSEKCGIGAARADVFNGSICILTRTARTRSLALQRARLLWRPLVHQAITMSPKEHDALLAATSHLPHLLAYCLMQAVDISRLARPPRSFLDMTRIAKSHPGLWDDIFATNCQELCCVMRRFEREWRTLRAHVVCQDRSALRRLLVRAQKKRASLDD